MKWSFSQMYIRIIPVQRYKLYFSVEKLELYFILAQTELSQMKNVGKIGEKLS